MSPLDKPAKLRARIELWTHRLGGKDIHSIKQQLSAMLWRSAYYRSINESRKFLRSGNGSLHGLINDGFICLQSLAVRRLVDRRKYNGPSGVNSLLNLITDIKGNWDLLTRENVLAARGLVYDYQPIEEAELTRSLNDFLDRGVTSGFGSPDGWFSSKCWHRVWDEVSETTETMRSKSDRPSKHRLVQLERSLIEAAKHVARYAHAHLAHAATDVNRQGLPEEFRSISLATLWTAERAIARIVGFVTRCFGDGAELGGVPIAQFDQFEFLDLPFAPAIARSAMEGAWAKHSSEIGQCRDWSWTQPLLSESDRWSDKEPVAGEE